MQEFKRTYLWGLDVKYRMGLYTTMAVFYKGIVNALMGEFSVDIRTMGEMLLLSFLFAIAETAIFPSEKSWTDAAMGRRAIVWAALANAVYVGGALVLGWFQGIPVWWGVIMAAVLELGLAGLWYALWLENQRDTRRLNESLRSFQQEM